VVHAQCAGGLDYLGLRAKGATGLALRHGAVVKQGVGRQIPLNFLETRL
jgi:hypothetical protein